MTHPSFERMRAVASALGSSAATVRGVAKFLRGDRRAPAAIRAAVYPGGPAHDWRGEVVFQRRRRSEWERGPIVTARKADPEAKRARDDKRFRRRYLAGLRRREVRALEFDGSNLAGLLARIDSRETRLAELAEVARLRTIATGKPGKPVELPKISAGSHPLRSIPIDATTARKVGASIDMRGKDATLAPCVSKSHGHHESGFTTWKNHRPKSYDRAVHDNYVRSFGLIVSPRRLETIFHETQVAIVLPDGFIWDRDANGLRAVDAASRRDDYHPDAAELLRKDAAAHIVGKINANRDRRREMAAKLAVEAAAVQGVYVCLADSIRAGNCRQGTLQFGQRHGLEAARHYSAPELLALANGDASRVRLAVTAARLRHEKEMAAGVCELSDHRA